MALAALLARRVAAILPLIGSLIGERAARGAASSARAAVGEGVSLSGFQRMGRNLRLVGGGTLAACVIIGAITIINMLMTIFVGALVAGAGLVAWRMIRGRGSAASSTVSAGAGARSFGATLFGSEGVNNPPLLEGKGVATRLFTLHEVAEQLGGAFKTVKRPERKVRDLVIRLGAPHRLDGQTMYLTQDDIAVLVGLMKGPGGGTTSTPEVLLLEKKTPESVEAGGWSAARLARLRAKAAKS
ncbi:hypothetical protein CCP2SC5_320010 [Azospirillaceae bacterium]